VVPSPAEAKDFSSSPCVQTSSETHPTSYPLGTRGPFPGDKARPERAADHSPHLVPRSRMSRSCLLLLGACMTVAGQLCLFYFTPRRRLRFVLRSVRPCGICGGQSGSGKGFSLRPLAFLCQYYATSAPYSTIYRLGVGQRAR
jgi:hypothetical protein